EEPDDADEVRGENLATLEEAAGRWTSLDEFLSFVAVCQRKTTGRGVGRVQLSSIHRCVAPETWVETPEGLRQIRDLPSNGMIATAVGPRAYSEVVRYEDCPMLRLRTRCGYEL